MNDQIKIHKPVAGKFDDVMSSLKAIDGWSLSMLASVATRGAQPEFNYLLALNVNGEFWIEPTVMTKGELESLSDLIAMTLADRDTMIAGIRAQIDKDLGNGG